MSIPCFLSEITTPLFEPRVIGKPGSYYENYNLNQLSFNIKDLKGPNYLLNNIRQTCNNLSIITDSKIIPNNPYQLNTQYICPDKNILKFKIQVLKFYNKPNNFYTIEFIGLDVLDKYVNLLFDDFKTNILTKYLTE